MIPSLKNISFLCLLLFAFNLSAQSDKIILKDSIWKVNYQDNPDFKEPNFDDSKWDSTATLFTFEDVGEENFKGVLWFRKHFFVRKEFRNTIVGVAVNQYGASEIYLDGKLIKKYGVVSADLSEEETYNPNSIPLPMQLDSAESHVIAIRFSDVKAYENKKRDEANITGFVFVVGEFDAIIKEYVSTMVINTRVRLFLGTTFLTIAFLHLILFLFYRKKKNNLFYSLFMFCTSLFLFIPEFALSSNDPDNTEWLFSSLRFVIPIFIGTFHALLYSLFYSKIPRFMFLMFGGMILTFILLALKLPFAGLLVVVLTLIVFVDSFRVCIKAILNKKPGAWIIGGGVLFLLITILMLLIIAIASPGGGLHIKGDSLLEKLMILDIILAILSLPASMTIYLAKDISRINKDLSKKLVEVQELSEKTIQQEKEKKKILENQKEELEIQVRERTKEISLQNELLETKNKEILDSINYAKRIQSAILPPDHLIKKHLPNSFVLYKPKDIVAGDFYWMEISKSGVQEQEQEQEGKGSVAQDSRLNTVLIAAADCTGHGVPGAMVSVVCNNGLNRSVREFGLTDPGKILDKTRELVIQEFEKSEEEVKDGMDIALLSLEQVQEQEERGSVAVARHSKLSYAGAHNPLWIIRKGAEEVEEIKANKQPIGKFLNPEPYTTHQVELNEGDTVYVFSDGYADQFGGADQKKGGKKFKSANFKKLLVSIQGETMEKQKEIINQTFEDWRGDLEQIDDVCVIGIRV